MTSTEQHDSAPEKASSLDARYGRTPARKRLVLWVSVAGAVAVGLVFVAWVFWAGLSGSNGELEARDVGYVIDGDSAVEVRFELSVAPGSPASCALQTLNSNFGIVGWKVVDIPASESRTRSFHETVLTTEQAVTGLIYRCWLT